MFIVYFCIQTFHLICHNQIGLILIYYTNLFVQKAIHVSGNNVHGLCIIYDVKCHENMQSMKSKNISHDVVVTNGKPPPLRLEQIQPMKSKNVFS